MIGALMLMLPMGIPMGMSTWADRALGSAWQVITRRAWSLAKHNAPPESLANLLSASSSRVRDNAAQQLQTRHDSCWPWRERRRPPSSSTGSRAAQGGRRTASAREMFYSCRSRARARAACARDGRRCRGAANDRRAAYGPLGCMDCLLQGYTIHCLSRRTRGRPTWIILFWHHRCHV